MRGKGIILTFILLSATLVIMFVVKRQERPQMNVVVGSNAPEIRVNDLSGKIYSLSELKGSVIFINFWATWCSPCREEMPSIQSLYNQFKDEKGFRMLTILYKDDYQKAVEYLRENNYVLPLLLDSKEKTAVSFGVTGVPETYIVDKKGILKEKVIGPTDWSSPQAISLISNLIRE